MTDRSIDAVIARLRFGDSDGDDHDIAADEIERLRRELTEALGHAQDAADADGHLAALTAQLAEARDTLARLLRDGILNAPCPTQRQWQQLKDFAAGYLTAMPMRAGQPARLPDKEVGLLDKREGLLDSAADQLGVCVKDGGECGLGGYCSEHQPSEARCPIPGCDMTHPHIHADKSSLTEEPR
jgi:hypothetical protein